MKLHNTLARKLDELKPLSGSSVRMYSCGPTVYDHIHIGNLSAFIFADMLRRTLAANNYEVQHVMNITDVDDKTIKRSQELYHDFEPLAALLKLTAESTAVFMDDMHKVGNDTSVMKFVKATDSIPAMQALIQDLHQRGFAYLADDGVYFSIDKYRASGKIYGQLTEITADSTSEARIQNDEYDKESAHDFALWKKQKPGEPSWEFKLDGKDISGRPGWHIECSAMSVGALGQPFDIHTGGVDLIFPHHENEIAQSTAGKDDPVYAKVFAHNEHVLVDGQKMSKSLNNFYTLKDIIDKGFDPLAFRLLVLQAHYRSQAHFSWDNLSAAQNRLRELRAMAALRYQPRAHAHDGTGFSFEDVPSELLSILSNDLNTPAVLAFLSDVTTQVNAVLLWHKSVGHFEVMLKGLDALLGLDLLSVPDINDAQKQLITERDAARLAKDWQKSDDLRNQLQLQGITLRDTDQGAIWSYL